MQITSIKTRALVSPKDSLLDAIRKSKLSLKEGDIVAISSKVVSIDEGRTVSVSEFPDKEKLIKREADWFMKAPRTARYKSRYTIHKGAMASGAGIDESNGAEHYILYPSDPFKSAKKWRTLLMKEFRLKELAVIITDSTSIPLRRGAIGFALSWDGLDPLHDYRGTKDIFGREIRVEIANQVDALAAAAVLAMGEGKEQTPLAVIRGAKNVRMKNRSPKADAQLLVELEDDVFAPLFFSKRFGWKKRANDRA